MSFTLTPSQDGDVATSAAWDDTAATELLATGSDGIGLRFQFPASAIDTITDTSIPAKPVNQTQPNVIYPTMTLNWVWSVGNATAYTLSVYVVNEADPDSYSLTNEPTTTDTNLVGTATGALPIDQDTFSLSLDMGPIAGAYRRTGWNRILAFAVFADSGSVAFYPDEHLTITGPQLVVGDPLPEFTGLVGHGPGISRADRCPRCGQPSLRETWIRDGYKKILVCPPCWDPPSVRRRLVTPRAPRFED
jgi:hypothetical protein